MLNLQHPVHGSLVERDVKDCGIRLKSHYQLEKTILAQMDQWSKLV